MASTDDVATYLTRMDDDIAACRAWGHEWPSRKLRPGKPLPKGYVPRLVDEGYIEITEACLNGCGKKRWYLLFPGGIYDTDVVRRYQDPKNWPVIPREVHITRRHIQAEVIRRSNELISEVALSTARSEIANGNVPMDAPEQAAPAQGAPAPRDYSASRPAQAIFRGTDR